MSINVKKFTMRLCVVQNTGFATVGAKKNTSFRLVFSI